MWEHHRRSLENLIGLLKKDEKYLAVILSGSLAQGRGRADSDVDVYLVATDAEYRRAVKNLATCYLNFDVCAYEGGYIDGKIICRDFLRRAAKTGSEPTRAAFIGAKVVWSRLENLQAEVDAIARFDEAGRVKKLRAFYAQAVAWGGYFYEESLKKENVYLRRKSVTETVFYCARYVLEVNRILFPGHKSLFAYAARAGDSPPDFIGRCERLLRADSPEAMRELLQSFFDFAPVTLAYEKCVSLFMENAEKNWLRGNPPLADC